MALPTIKSTGKASKEFISPLMSPAMEPLKAAGSALGNPLQTLSAPPAVMAAASAMGTMFGGEGKEKPDKKLSKAGSKLSESADNLDNAAKSLGGKPEAGEDSNVLDTINENLDTPTMDTTSLLENILEDTFHLEDMMNTLDQIRDSVLELVEKIVGQRRQPKGAEDEEGKKIGGQFMVKREAVAKIDPTARLKAIEEKREAARAKKKSGGGASAGGEEEEGSFLSGILDKIPGMGLIKSLFGGAGSILKVFSKILLPLTIIIGVFSFVTGFMEGYKEGGIIEGIKVGFQKVIANLIDIPLNFFKDIVAWIAGALGFKDVEEQLNSFDFDFAGGFGRMFDSIRDFFTYWIDFIKDIFSWENLKKSFPRLAWIAEKLGMGGDEGESFDAKRIERNEKREQETAEEIETDEDAMRAARIAARKEKNQNTEQEVEEETAAVKPMQPPSSLKDFVPKEGAANTPRERNRREQYRRRLRDEALQSPKPPPTSEALKEGALQTSERTAAAGNGGGTIIAPSNVTNTSVSQSSGQTVVSAPISATRGDGNLEAMALQP